ncbi:MAG: hypothetical protein A3G18_07500 [Rhodospirillales bacterium RIFCSPLOWO2_12_FULL_58_28]|nr:MAG: hypothetical protein A3H92_08975 [Rhodospirillales bacterium RIFCSPLOWO2_02_FULL_58_16]OHC77569.1 MAG: hypothetical protein A3G18_07500 [Rhodospirillales bacterium RIFCSPLOWO2_12_FULL_58_28]
MSEKIIGFQYENHRSDNRRPTGDLRFVIAGEEFQVVDISMGGFSLADPKVTLYVGQEVVVSEVRSGKDALRLGADAEVVRDDPDTGNVGCQFFGVSPAQFDIIERLVMHRPLLPKKKAR